MNYSEVERNGLYSAGSHEENVFFAVFYIVIFVISVPCNALALWIFVRGKNCGASKVFLMNLAIADMSYLLVLPMRVVYHASDSNWPLGEASCRLVGFLFFLNLYCSMYFVMLISLDRLLAVVLPLKSQRLRRKRSAQTTSVMLWITVVVLMLPVLFSPQTVTIRTETRNVTVCSQLYLEKASSRSMPSTAVAFSIPLVTLTVSYILILRKLRLMNFQDRTRIQRKAVTMIVMTVVLFLVAFVPYHVYRLIYIGRIRGRVSDAEIRSLAFFNRLTSAITCVSGVLDPVMYFFLARNYQKALLNMCGRTSEKENPQSTT
ncbi:uracil nucleotide/cysteinyl leukotriene receptor [Brachyhypopomus gauderio]|uniref:uracil nucleotide/cysteinyl leukotriene receptor n=1 Tax=Brachyhypopomus gauderio TaxID=698409 RepID=UPI004041D363